jgi:predicted RNase H-like HicB family nuclease
LGDFSPVSTYEFDAHLGGYHVFCPTLPGCHTQSETIEEGIQNIREAIELYVGSLVEDGLPIPTEDILIKPIEIPA